MEQMTIGVEGMSCEHCVAAVKGALEELTGILSTEVSLEGKSATVSYDPSAVTPEQMKEAIESQGFDAP